MVSLVWVAVWAIYMGVLIHGMWNWYAHGTDVMEYMEGDASSRSKKGS
jgi:hypothetical protein